MKKVFSTLTLFFHFLVSMAQEAIQQSGELPPEAKPQSFWEQSGMMIIAGVLTAFILLTVYILFNPKSKLAQNIGQLFRRRS
jgi:hypothetical protein